MTTSQVGDAVPLDYQTPFPGRKTLQRKTLPVHSGGQGRGPGHIIGALKVAVAGVESCWNDTVGSISQITDRILEPRGGREGFGQISWALQGCVLAAALMLGAVAAHGDVADETVKTDRTTVAVEPLSIDCQGSGGAMDDQGLGPCQVLSGGRLTPDPAETHSLSEEAGGPAGLSVTSILEFEVQDPDLVRMRFPGTGLSLTDDPAAENGEISLRRVSTTLTGSEGTLTVGNNWSNFQDFLPPASSSLASRGLTAEQLSWATRQELGEISVTLEGGYELVGHGEPLSASLSDLPDAGGSSSPSLALSWRGSTQDKRSMYGISALGRELELDDQGSTGGASDTGWGLNLFGGWHFGELFAALSVTLGNSIDSFILGRVGDRETASAATRYLHPGKSININPMLNYRLSEHSNIHLSVNRFSSESEDTPHGVETLDTIHLGYSWTPWPSTRLGIEFVGKDVEGTGPMEDSKKVNIAASKRF